MTLRVLVAGAGAIGQWLGGRLQGAGHDVTLLVREAHADAIAGGLVIRGHTDHEGTIPCITSPSGGPFDAIFVTTKAHATAAVGEAVAPLLAVDGVLASLQNGLGNGEKLASIVGADRVALCLTSHGVTIESPGRLFHAGTGPTKVGPMADADPAAARRAHTLLTDAGLEPSWHAAIRGHVWQKAIVNAAINPVGAIWGVQNGDILANPELHAVSHALAREATALAQKARVDLPPGDPVATVDSVLAATADNRCSMLQDVDAKRPTEIEQITGRMVRLGELLLVSMPRSDAIYSRLKQAEAAYLGARASEAMAWEELRFATVPI